MATTTPTPPTPLNLEIIIGGAVGGVVLVVLAVTLLVCRCRRKEKRKNENQLVNKNGKPTSKSATASAGHSNEGFQEVDETNNNPKRSGDIKSNKRSPTKDKTANITASNGSSANGIHMQVASSKPNGDVKDSKHHNGAASLAESSGKKTWDKAVNSNGVNHNSENGVKDSQILVHSAEVATDSIETPTEPSLSVQEPSLQNGDISKGPLARNDDSNEHRRPPAENGNRGKETQNQMRPDVMQQEVDPLRPESDNVLQENPATPFTSAITITDQPPPSQSVAASDSVHDTVKTVHVEVMQTQAAVNTDDIADSMKSDQASAILVSENSDEIMDSLKTDHASASNLPVAGSPMATQVENSDSQDDKVKIDGMDHTDTAAFATAASTSGATKYRKCVNADTGERECKRISVKSANQIDNDTIEKPVVVDDESRASANVTFAKLEDGNDINGKLATHEVADQHRNESQQKEELAELTTDNGVTNPLPSSSEPDRQSLPDSKVEGRKEDDSKTSSVDDAQVRETTDAKKDNRRDLLEELQKKKLEVMKQDSKSAQNTTRSHDNSTSVDKDSKKTGLDIKSITKSGGADDTPKEVVKSTTNQYKFDPQPIKGNMHWPKERQSLDPNAGAGRISMEDELQRRLRAPGGVGLKAGPGVNRHKGPVKRKSYGGAQS